jgi:hypothetical protein
MILTTGSMYEKLFESYSKIPRYKVLGSSKATSSFMVKSETFQNQALFAPEGTTISTVRYLKLINYLCSTNSELKLTIRFHPNLKANLTINYLVKKLRSKSNFFVSTNSLDEDLKQSKFVFYRSSAVGVLSLMSDATPVFYGDPIEVGLNALGKYSALFPVVTTQKEAAKLLNQEPISMSKKDRTRLFNEYFSRIDYSLLDSLV